MPLTDSISADPPTTTVEAQVGSSVLLPCKLTTEFTSTSVVRWHNNEQDVFERSSHGICTSADYEGRVDVPKDELLKGNCSLVLKNVSVADDSFYKTFVMKHDTADTNHVISKVKLSVGKEIMESKIPSNFRSQNVSDNGAAFI